MFKAKFHYASWFEAGSKLVADRFNANSITLSGSKLVRSRVEAGSKLVRSWSPTSFEPDSVMEFGFNRLITFMFSLPFCFDFCKASS